MIGKIRLATIFAFTNFGPLIVFYSANHFVGLKAAISCSMLFCIGEIAYSRSIGVKLTSLFKFSAGMTFIFGTVDLAATESLLFKYEAAVTNGVTAIFFAMSLFSERSLIQEFYEKRPDAKPITQAKIIYFRWLTMVWVAYFIVKALIYAWVAHHHSLSEILLIRTLVGSLSFYGLLALSIFGSKKLFPRLQAIGFLPRT